MRSRHTLPLLLLTLLIGGGTIAVVMLIEWLPEQASRQADRVHDLLWYVIWASVVIFTIVTVVLVYCALRFRAKPGDESDGPPIHGHTKLEVVWSVIPGLLLAVLAVWAYLALSNNEALAKDRLVLNVTAEQFSWRFTYPQDGITSGDLRVPVNRQVELEMRSKDVIHDLYVPQFYVKEDVVPGVTTHVIFNPTKTGTFQISCNELCGVGHGVMRARVIVMEPAAYQAWLAGAKAQVAQQARAASSGQSQVPAGQGASAQP